MQHPDEGTIHTWLDGELPADESAELEAHVAECSDCAAAVAEARGFIAGSSRIVSALDIVPGDVIPIGSSRKRSWYSSTQLRAAAAVLFVAGASLLLFRDGNQAKMATVLDSRAAESSTSSAAVPAPTEAPVQESRDAAQDVRALKTAIADGKDETSAARDIESQLKRNAAQKESRRAASSTVAPTASAPVTATPTAPGIGSVRKEGDQADTRNFSVSQAPPPAAAASSGSAGPAPRMRTNVANPQLSEVVVTGVATEASTPAAAPPPPVAPLRLVRADTSGAIIRTTFEVRPGVSVTLAETPMTGVSGAATSGAATSTPQRQLAAPLSKSAPRDASSKPLPPGAPAVYADSITWVSAVSGKSYVLTGPLTKAELTVLRNRLPQNTR